MRRRLLYRHVSNRNASFPREIEREEYFPEDYEDHRYDGSGEFEHAKIRLIQAMDRERNNAYHQGYMVAVNRLQAQGYEDSLKSKAQGQFTREDVERARSQGVLEGMRRSQEAMRRDLDPNSRDSVISEALEKCRIIEESNPQMSAGAKAVAHMIRKMRKS